MKSTVHTCHNQHLGENKPLRCTCRKKISLAEATKQVEKGFAQWIIKSQTTTTTKEICLICSNGETKKSCQNCKKSGLVEVSHQVKSFGTDIVLVTAGTADEKGNLVYKPVLALKTPRVATIEAPHIIRAYVYNVIEEQERVEIYGLLTLQARIEMGIGVEPPDDPKTGTGRNCDYGRSPFARISDERTSLGIGKIGARISEGYKQINSDAKDGEE